MWGRLDGAIRVVDLMVDAGQTSNVDIIADALVPLEQDADAADRRALVVEALVDVGTPDVPRIPLGSGTSSPPSSPPTSALLRRS